MAIAGVHAFRNGSRVDDLALLPVTEGPSSALDLAAAPVTVGDPVWLLARSENPLQASELEHRARVVSDRGTLIFIYDNPLLQTANVSGAPVVSSNGKVVGVNVAAGRLADGMLVGVADDLATLSAAVITARHP